jgi:hypothetical protein
MTKRRCWTASGRWHDERAVWSSLSFVAFFLVSVIVVACGGDRAEDSSGTVAPSVAARPTAPDRDSIWPVMPLLQVDAAADSATVVATQVVVGLNSDDPTLFVSQFVDGGFVIDPIDPIRTPSVESYHPFEHDLCDSWGLEEVFVNATGSLSKATCEGFFESIPGGPDSMDAVRHLPMADGLATNMMHRLDVEAYGAYPEETVTIIGFSSTWAEAVVEQVDAASKFEEALIAAWESGDPDQVEDLYAPDAIREDPFLGLSPDSASTLTWPTRLLEHYDTVSISVENLYASALGPAAIYELVLGNAGIECGIRQASVWNLDDDGIVTYEWVYYDRSTLNECGWWG